MEAAPGVPAALGRVRRPESCSAAGPLPSPRWQCSGAKNQEMGRAAERESAAGGVNELSLVNSR